MADPTSQTKELLTLELGVDVKAGLFEARRFQSHLTNNMKKVQQQVVKLDKGVGKFWKQLGGARARSKGIKELAGQFKALDKVVKDRGDLIADALGQAKKAKRGSQERKDLMARVQEIKKTSGYSAAWRARQGARTAGKELQETKGFDWKELNEGAEEAGESLSEPLRDLLSKDAPTLMRRMNKILLGAHAKAGKVGEVGSDLRKRGVDMWKGGGAKGKVVGGAAAVGGGLTQLFGGLAKVITSIGPILSVASSFMMSFVKILIDAESAAKDFNKQILATTGTSGYLKRNFGDVGDATKALDASLRAARDGAMDWSNVQWGISKETAVAFQSAITAEGVALDRLGNAMGDATEDAEAHAKSIQMGVAYSRAFGVSLNEIATMQGQLMSDLGMGAETVQTSFQTIVNAAHDAGMETNKFFGIVRSFSSDLSLFTLRLAEVSKIMGVLGKTMDPRKMGQFLQTLNQKFTGGLMDNLKFEMLAGPESKKIATEDAATKLSNLTKDLTSALGEGSDKDIDDLMRLLKDPRRNPREIAKWQAKHQAKLNGTLNESIQDNANVQTKLASGDKIDQASIMDSLSPLAKMETLEAASKKLTGKGFDKLSGLSLAAVEATGIASAKEIQMFMKLKQGIMQGQEELIDRVGKGLLTADDEAMLARLNIKAQDKEGRIEELRGLFEKEGGDKAFMNALEKSQQELLMDSAKEIDYQKETAGFQTSMMDRIGMIADILLNQIYGVMSDIYDSVIDIVGLMKFGRDRKAEFSRSQVAANRSGDAELRNIFTASGGDLTKAKTEAIEKVANRARENVQKAIAEHDELKARLASGKDDAATKAQIENRMTELAPALTKEMRDLAGAPKAFKEHLYRVGASEDLGGVPAVIQELSKMLKVGRGAGAGPVPAGTPAGAAQPAGAPAAPATTKSAKEPPTAAQQQATTASVDQLQRTVGSDGVKLAPQSVSGLGDKMADSVYKGAAKALFEYYMYSGLSRSTVAGAMSLGIAPGAIAQQAVTDKSTPEAALGALMANAQPNAMGGTVTGIMNGMARVTRPAPGEGFASVGRGERIVPAGGGGGAVKVELELKGDFRRFVQARVVEGAASHDRNKRLR